MSTSTHTTSRRRPGRPRPRRPQKDVAGRITWAVIAAAAVALAVVTFAATMAASSANDEWQEAVRVESRQTASTLENIRSVYEDEAPLALSITAALIRAQELDRHAATGSFLAVQADAERRTAGAYLDTFRRDVPDSPVTRLLGSGDDPEVVARTHPLGQHLVALQASSSRAADQAAALWAAGDHDATRTRGFLWAMTASALVVLVGFAAGERRRRARAAAHRTPTAAAPPAAAGPGVWPGTALALAALLDRRRGPERSALPARLAVGLLVGAAVGGVLLRGGHAPTVTRGNTDAADELVAVLGPPALPAVPPERPTSDGGGADRSPLPAVVLAVLAVVATALQIDASTAENQYLAAAARGADRVGTVAVGAGPREAFSTNGTQSVLLMEHQADDVAAAGLAGPTTSRALAAALADADRSAAARIATVVTDLATPPERADGLDPLSATAVSASWLDREAEQRAQAAAASAAEAAGRRADGYVRVLLALTLAANAVEIGHSSRLNATARHVVVRVGWLLAAAAAVLTAWTVLIG